MSAPARPSVSVVVAAYDEERWIAHSLRSLLRQSRPADEIVVVDDGSRDATWRIAEGLGVRVLRRPHLGAAAARDAGLRAVAGDVVVFADADDVYAPEFLDRLTRPFADPGVTATFPGGVSWLNADEGLAQQWLRVRGLDGGRPPAYGETNPIAKAVRRAALLRVGGYPRGGYGEDQLLGQLIGPAQVVPDARWQVTLPATLGEIFRSARWIGRGPRFERERPALWRLLPPASAGRALRRLPSGGIRLACVQAVYDAGRLVGYAESRVRPRLRAIA